MFKSKIDFNAFDLHNKKVKNIEEPKVKAFSKSSVKKLLSKPDERTSFHLILDYFKDKANKPLGHFLCFGVNKKMNKHFEQVEMKSGKADKSMSANQKEASMGEAYAKEEGGKMLLCFEPSPKSKVPKGKWPKILKALKPFLAGAKAVVVIDGTVIGEETDLAEESANNTDTSTETASNETNLAAFKAQINHISNALKQTLPKDIIPKVKNRTVAEADLSTVKEIKAKIAAFEEAYEQATETVQAKLAQVRSSIAQQAPKVEQIMAAVEKLLTKGETTDPNEDSTTAVLRELLELAKKGLKEFDKKYEQLKEELENFVPAPLASGDDFVKQMG